MTTDVEQAVASAVAFELSRADRSKKWLAEKTGIPYSTLDRKMKAQVDFTFTDLGRIASVLDVSPSAFTPPAFVPVREPVAS